MRGENRGRASLTSSPMGAIFWVILAVISGLTGCQPGSDTPDNAAARQHVDAMSDEHAGDHGSPSAAAGIEPERSVVAETLPYAEVEDELVYGHFVFPSDMVDPLPALIVVHEWWGLNEGVRAMADRLAGEGYIVLAVDLFNGKTAEYSPDARQLMLEVVENPQRANENIRQAFSFVRETAGASRIGVLGWCFGGGWALNAGMLLPDELDALVIYYGQVTDDREMLAPIDAPILGLFAGSDRGIPVSTVEGFQDALRALNKNHEIIIYPDVGHAFANPSGNNYNPEVAQLAWEKTVSFLNFHLGRGTVTTPVE